MAGAGIRALAGEKPMSNKALSAFVTARTEQAEMLAKAPHPSMMAGLREHLAKHFPEASAAGAHVFNEAKTAKQIDHAMTKGQVSAAKSTDAKVKAPRSAERNAALLNKLQDRAGRASMKNDPSYEQKRSRLLAVKAALPAEHIAAAESARVAKQAASSAQVKAMMRSKGGPGMRQIAKELDAAKRAEAGQPAAVKAPKVAKVKPEPVAQVSKPPVHEARRNAPMTEENRLDGGTLKPRIASATTVKETMDQWHEAANRTTKKEAMSEVKSLTPHSPNPPVAMKSMARQYGDDALVATRDARIAKAHAQHQDGIAASLTAKGDHAGARKAAEAASGHRAEMGKAMEIAASKRRTASGYRRDYAKVTAGLSEGAKTVFRLDQDTQAMYRGGSSQRTSIKPIPRAQ